MGVHTFSQHCISTAVESNWNCGRSILVFKTRKQIVQAIILSFHQPAWPYSAKTVVKIYNTHTLKCTHMWGGECAGGCSTPVLLHRSKQEKNEAKHLWLSLHLFFPFFCSSLSATPRTRLPFLSLENGSTREWVIDKCDTITSTCTHTHTRSSDWQAWHQSVTPQRLPVKLFDWQSPSPVSSMCSLIMKQWNSMSGQKTDFFFSCIGNLKSFSIDKFSSALKPHFHCTRPSSCTVRSKWNLLQPCRCFSMGTCTWWVKM